MNYMQPPIPNGMSFPASALGPPRRVYGSFPSDGVPLPPTVMPTGLYADDLMGYGLDDGGDQNDLKRRRIARACDMCRKKKIKCDGRMPACTHCQNYKTECIFTQVEKKRSPPKGAKYIEGLENRLGRMESLLRLSGLLPDDSDDTTDLGTLEKRLMEKAAAQRRGSELPLDSPSEEHERPLSSSSNAPGHLSDSSDPDDDSSEALEIKEKKKKKKKEEEVEALSDMMCSLVTNNCGETRYIGSSSGFSIFSPKGIQWVNQKTGDVSFQEMIANASVDDNKWIHWKPDVFQDIFRRQVYQQLPPKTEALSLLKDYFENFNCMFPLFHEPTFMHLVDKHYSRDPYEGSGWWASLNVALAIAHRLRVMSQLVPQDEDQKAWGYLKNAMAVQAELTIRNTDLLSVQALLGMAMFLQGTPNPQPSFFLVAAAIRSSHSIGLHKRGSGFNLNPSESEQRKRVFWIAYMLDRDLCLRSGRPPVQDDDDMNVELPSEDPPDNIGNIPLADGKGKINLFRLMCRFATIASKVYRRLYSVKASKQSDGELLSTIGELDRELEEWKDSIPIDFRPEHEIKASHTPLVLHIVVLHFAYYNCLTTIHRMSVHHGYWTSRLSNYAIQGLNARPLNPRIFSSAALCVSAARASIQLIKYIPHGDFDCVWLCLYYPVSALVTLFANILQNPTDTRARTDLKLMNHVVTFLNELCAHDDNSSVKRMLSVCSEFERIAIVVLDKSEKEAHSRRKRKQQDGKDEANKARDTTGASTAASTTPTPAAGQHVPQTPQPSQPGNIPNVFTPPDMSKYLTEEALQSFNMTIAQAEQLGLNQSPAGAPFLSPQSQFSNVPNGHGRHTSVAFSDASATSPAMLPGDVGMSNSFQHPFVPQDLWQMPMTLEWDWAGMTDYSAGGGFDGISNAARGAAGAPGGPAPAAALGLVGGVSGLPSSGPWVERSGHATGDAR